MTQKNIFSTDRRTFLRVGALTALSVTTPGFFSITKSDKPNGKVRLAMIGCGGRGEADLFGLYRTGLCEVVALCDTDIAGKPCRKAVKKFDKAEKFTDFRKMFDAMKGKIDAVAVATPDVSHFAIVMDALRRGYPVYCEKPLAHSFEECELMVRAAAKAGVVTQMGNQGHSEGNYWQFRQYVRDGVIKPNEVTKVVSHMNFDINGWYDNKWQGKVSAFAAKEPIPEGLNWDCWLATNVERDYSHEYMHGDWRCWHEFGAGCIGDWGAHVIDTVHEFCDLGLPTEVKIADVKGWNGYVFPLTCTLTFSFPKTEKHRALDILWYEGKGNLPSFEGVPKGAKLNKNVGREIYMADGSVWHGSSHGDTIRRLGDNFKPGFPKPPSNHYENFLRAVKGEEKANSPFSVGGPLSQALLLGSIAQYLNRGFKFDPVKKVCSDPAATAMLKRPVRKGWEEYYKV